MKRILIFALCLLLLLCGCHSSQPEETTSITETPTEEITVPETTEAGEPEITETAEPETTASAAPEITEAPQLYIEFTREGVTDRIPVELARGTVGNYTICYDPERFVQDGDVFKDFIWGDAPPIVYYAVSYHPDMTAQELVTGLILQNESDFASYETKATTVGQYQATGVYFSGSDALMTQFHFFAIDAPSGGSYLLETQFVMEMYEGLYPQILAALDTFSICE